MALTCTLWSFNKKPNSTAIPATVGDDYSIEITETSSIINPRVVLKGNPMTSGTLATYNYARISSFSRYYFITDITYDATSGFWILNMSVDVLASAKTAISNSLQYIERSASSWNLDLIDTQYPTKASPQYFNRIYSAFFNATPANGLYILGIVSRLNNPTRFGGLQYWIMTSAQLNALVQYMLGVDVYAGASLTGIAADLLGFIGEPLQFIASCKFMPRTIIDISQMTAEQINFGVYPASGCNGYKLPDTFLNPAPVILDGFTIPVDDHPQVATRGVWLNSNKTTRRTLRFEPWGCIPIDSSKLVGYSYIACVVETDIITGSAILSLYASTVSWAQIVDVTTLPLLGTYSTNLLVDIPLSQFRHEGYLKSVLDNVVQPITSTGANQATGFINGAMSAGVLGGMAGAVTSTINGANNMAWTIEDGLANFYGPAGSSGVPGSLLCRTEVILSSCFMLLVDEDNAQWGRPLCERRSLSNMSGYVKCKGADLGTSLTQPENDMIIGFLNSGFYME